MTRIKHQSTLEKVERDAQQMIKNLSGHTHHDEDVMDKLQQIAAIIKREWTIGNTSKSTEDLYFLLTNQLLDNTRVTPKGAFGTFGDSFDMFPPSKPSIKAVMYLGQMESDLSKNNNSHHTMMQTTGAQQVIYHSLRNRKSQKMVRSFESQHMFRMLAGYVS